MSSSLYVGRPADVIPPGPRIQWYELYHERGLGAKIGPFTPIFVRLFTSCYNTLLSGNLCNGWWCGAVRHFYPFPRDV